MKTRGLKELSVPKNIAIHGKMLLFCLIATPMLGLILNTELNADFLVGTFSMMFIEIEILAFLAIKLLAFGEGHTRKELTKIYLSRLLIFYVLALVICTLTFVLFLYVQHAIKGWRFPDLFAESTLKPILYVAKVTAIGLLFSMPVFFYGQWQEALKREHKLREQSLIFQNETLKNQVNPHFLFNSLNTLSALVTTQTELAERFVSRLSSIYRYILENSAKDTVPLKDELDFLESYFYLHKIREDGKIRLQMDVKGVEKYKVLPVSLQMLIENAIKHNMATREKPLIISIALERSFIVVKNNFQPMASALDSTHMGHKNLSERIQLLTGKDLIVEQTGGEFIVKIPLLTA